MTAPMTNTTPDKRKVALSDLNHLLSFPQLGAWGMDALKDTLAVLIPDLNQAGHSTIEE
jgi:hypothetical protein